MSSTDKGRPRARAGRARAATACAPSRSSTSRWSSCCRSPWSSTAPSRTACSRCSRRCRTRWRQHALFLTVVIAAIAVPLNTLFGVFCALLLVRRSFPGKAFLNTLIDVPFAVSPIVVGLALVLVYGRTGWFGGWLMDSGIRVIFAWPSMVLATIFVSLPFVVREVVPVLQEVGVEQDQAAHTLGATHVADVLAHHPAGDPRRRDLRRRPHDGAGARRVRRREHRERQDRRAHLHAHRARRGAVPAVRPRRRVHVVARPRASSPWSSCSA